MIPQGAARVNHVLRHVSGRTGAVSVSVGADDACALLTDQRVECWGNALTPIPKIPLRGTT